MLGAKTVSQHNWGLCMLRLTGDRGPVRSQPGVGDPGQLEEGPLEGGWIRWSPRQEVNDSRDFGQDRGYARPSPSSGPVCELVRHTVQSTVPFLLLRVRDGVFFMPSSVNIC